MVPLFVFLFCGRSQLVIELYNLRGVENLYSAPGGSYNAVFMVTHRKGSYIALPLLSLEVATSDLF